MRDDDWISARAAAGALAAAEVWRRGVAAAVRHAADARFTIVSTCVPGRWDKNQRDCDPPALGHLREELVLEHADAARAAVVAPLEELALPAELAAEYRRALARHGLAGYLAGILRRSDGAVLGTITVGAERDTRALLDTVAGPLRDVVTIASDTISGALALARGFVAPVPQHLRSLDMLTDREREIAELLCAGCSDMNVASRLAISENTVGSHVTRIFRKLGVHSRSEMIARLNSVLPA